MRKAFTLLELLAVIAIISLIIGILLPAVNAARETARKIRCINNQRNLAVALLHYDETKGHLPGWREFDRPVKNATGEVTAAQAQVSWAFIILPFCEQQDMYGRIKSGEVAPNTPIPMVPIFHCPSRYDGPGDYTQDAFGRSMNYIVNCGAVDDCSARDPEWTTDDNPANGVFLDLAAITSGIPDIVNINKKKPKQVNSRLSDISRQDGTAYTIMLSENVQRGFWISSTLTDFACLRDGTAFSPDTPKNLSGGQDQLEGMVGFCWSRLWTGAGNPIQYPEAPVQKNSPYRGFIVSLDGKPVSDNPNDKYAPGIFNPGSGQDSFPDADRFPCYVNQFRDKIFPNTKGGCNWYWSSRPSSQHPRIVVMSFCDGNIRSISDSIDELVYVQMMTVSDAKSDAANFTGNTLFDPSWLD